MESSLNLVFIDTALVFFFFNLFHIYFAVSVVEFERVDAVWHYSEKRFLNFQIYLFLLF